MNRFVITPKTKIHDLLNAYPNLEDILIDQAPQFTKLRNPLLRKTIARVTTLGQAAAVGGLKVEDLVNVLRREAGQTDLSDFDPNETPYITRQPEWFDKRNHLYWQKRISGFSPRD